MPTRLTGPNPRNQASSRAYPGGVAGNSSTPSSPPTRSSAAATCASACVSTPPVTAHASPTMVNVIPFRVEGWHAPAGRPDLEPRPLAQARQIRPAAPVGAKGTWSPADRSFRKTTSGVSRLAGQAGTQTTDPTPKTTHSHGSRAGSTIHILPAESERLTHMLCASAETRKIGQFRARPVALLCPQPLAHDAGCGYANGRVSVVPGFRTAAADRVAVPGGCGAAPRADVSRRPLTWCHSRWSRRLRAGRRNGDGPGSRRARWRRAACAGGSEAVRQGLTALLSGECEREPR